MEERREDYIGLREYLESKIRTEETFLHMKDLLDDINKTLKESAREAKEDRKIAAEERAKNEHRHTTSEVSIRWIKRIGIVFGGTAIGKWAITFFS